MFLEGLFKRKEYRENSVFDIYLIVTHFSILHATFNTEFYNKIENC